jgi:serine/threonine protein kinase
MRYLQVGKRINQYEIQNWLMFEGRARVKPYLEGGLGIVYRAYDLNIGDPVVLKTYKGPVSRTSRQAQLFREEAGTWVRLGHHPHIVRAFDVFEYDARYYIAIEFVSGGSLRVRIGHLNLEEALRIALGICRGMMYASETLDLVHRDLKPENILLASRAVAKITDFGLARIFDEERLPRPGAVGTWGYMAPEQRKDARMVDTTADIYSFGVILHELLTGQRPGVDPRFLPGVAGEQPPMLKAIVERCLRTEPQERFPNFRTVFEKLQPLASALGVKEPEPVDARESDLIHDIVLSIPTIELRTRGDNFLKLEKFEDAVACYTRLLQMEPDRASVLSRRGQAYLRSGRYAEAESDFDRALALAPGEVGALLGEGDLCAERGDLAQAFRYYDAAVQSDQDSWETVTHRKAGILEQSGDYTTALNHYDALLQREHTAELLVSKAAILEKMGQSAEALILCGEALRVEPNSMRALALKAHLHDWLNQPHEALAAFLRLLDEDPEIDRPWLLNRIGIIYGLAGDHTMALRYHKEASQLEGDNADYLFNWASDLEKLNRWAEAAQLYESFLTVNSSAAEAWYRLGKARAEMGNFESACEALKQCLHLEDHSNARLLLDYLKQDF